MSVVQICNRGASQYLGLPRVNNLSEGTPQSEQYELHYDDLRRSLLEKHWWVFAKCLRALAPVANDRPDEWLFKYERPAGVLDVHWINDRRVATMLMQQGKDPSAPYESIGTYIYTNVERAFIQFTRDQQNTDLMPQYFKDALSAMVASAVAMPLTESVSRARFATEQAQIMIDIAIAGDEQNTPAITMPDAEYIDARSGRAFGDPEYLSWRR